MPIQERRKSPTQVALISYSACHTFPPVVFLAFLAPLRCVAQNRRIPAIFELSEFIPDTLLLAFVFDVTTHSHQQCASTHLANSASPISFNRHDPFTHVCNQATDRCWMDFSECVIVIVIGLQFSVLDCSESWAGGGSRSRDDFRTCPQKRERQTKPPLVAGLFT